ncbi:MAG TPA: hypothetical protein DCS63_04105 [Elusimicrobia bacterium]|nr:hypothetical protein [Elusimicrobiota bacterium]
MTIGDSFFSFIKPSPARPAPKSAAAPPPPPKKNDALTGKAADLELKIKKLEEQYAAPASAAQGPGRLAQETAELRARVASLEEIIRRPEFSDLSAAPLGVDHLERRLNGMESGLASDIKERFSTFDAVLTETARKAALALQAASGAAQRIEKLEEGTTRVEHIKNRLESLEGKLEKIYDLDALVQSLKASVEGMGKNVNGALRDSALISAEHKKLFSDFDSLANQVRHFSALFSQMRTELAFLTPKKQEDR